MTSRKKMQVCLLGALLCAMFGVSAVAVSAAVSPAKHASVTGASRPARIADNQTSPPITVFAGSSHDARVSGDASERCLVRGNGPRTTETCGTSADIDEGQTIGVSDECGSSGSNRMTITGLAPEGTHTVRLRFSDGSSKDTTVEAGAFIFEGTNPGTGDPYPTGVRWLGSGGTDLGTAELPVVGDQFCIEPPEPPAAP